MFPPPVTTYLHTYYLHHHFKATCTYLLDMYCSQLVTHAARWPALHTAQSTGTRC